jgi:hypothetical protein
MLFFSKASRLAVSLSDPPNQRLPDQCPREERRRTAKMTLTPSRYIEQENPHCIGTFHAFLMVEPSILQYRLQKDQQMLKEVVNYLLIRSKFLHRHDPAYVCHPQGVVSA